MNLKETKAFLCDYIDSGYRSVSYMCDGYVKLRYSETEYLSIVPNQIIRVMYKDDQIEHIKFGDDVYVPYWNQRKMERWIDDKFRLVKAQFIRVQ